MSDRDARVRRKDFKSLSSWDEEIPIPVLPYPVCVLIVGIFAVICFSNSLTGDFVFDDSEAIVNNNDVKSLTSLSTLFTNDFWGTRLTHPSSHKSYRPLTVLSFRCNYMFGGLDPLSYHVVNLILHCCVSVLSLHVFKSIFGSSSPRAALLAAILFAAHPIHTESVSGIVGRADLLCAFFVFICLLSYVKVINLSNSNNVIKYSKQYRLKTSGYMLLCAICTTAAMLCKEVGITALGLCSAYDILLANGGIISRLIISLVLKEHLHVSNLWKQSPSGCVRNVVFRHILLFMTGMGLLTIRWYVMGSTVPKFMRVDNPASFLDNTLARVVNYQYIYGLNVLLLIFPIWLCFDWSMGCVPVITEFTDPRLIVIPLMWIMVFLLIKRGLNYRGQTSRYVLISLALGIIPFLPASNIFFRVGFVIAERVLYLPAAGVCILVVTGIRELAASRRIGKKPLQIFYSLLIIIYFLRCQQRSREWLTEKDLFKAGLLVCPLNAKVHYNMGKVAADSGDVKEAVSRYREALRLNRDYDQAMNNLANILKDQGDLKEALILLKKATSIRPDFAAAWMNLGIVEASLGEHKDAETSYLTALKHRAVYPDCLYNLGNLYLETKDHEKALSTWKNATELKPSLAVAWTNMLILMDSEGQYDKAIDIAEKALQHLPDEPALHFNLANTLGKLYKYKDSETHFLLATKLDSNNGNYWANLGVLYHRWRKYDKAEKTYRHALRLNPHLRSAHDNLNMLLKAKEKNVR